MNIINKYTENWFIWANPDSKLSLTLESLGKLLNFSIPQTVLWGMEIYEVYGCEGEIGKCTKINAGT